VQQTSERCTANQNKGRQFENLISNLNAERATKLGSGQQFLPQLKFFPKFEKV
jgi:hypothetical protein